MQVLKWSYCAQLLSRRRMLWAKRNDSIKAWWWLGFLMNLRCPKLRTRATHRSKRNSFWTHRSSTRLLIEYPLTRNRWLEPRLVRVVLWQPPPTRSVDARVDRHSDSNNIQPTSRRITRHRVLPTRQQPTARTAVMFAPLLISSANGGSPPSRWFQLVHSHSYRHRICNNRVEITSWHQSTRLSLSPIARTSQRPNFTGIRLIELRTKAKSLRWTIVA